MEKYCIRCGIISKHCVKGLCRKCYDYEYYKKNKEKINKRNGKYYQDNKIKAKESAKRYYLANKENIDKRIKKYDFDNKDDANRRVLKYYYRNKKKCNEKYKLWQKTDSGKLTISKLWNKRKRKLGFIHLNNRFGGCEGHHVNKDYVIFIPKDMHRNIWHNQNKPETMIKINTLAFEYLTKDTERWDLKSMMM